MAYKPLGWENDVTELSAENFNYMNDGITKSYPVKLISVSEEAPSEFNTGDKYYNKTNNKIYTAISTSEFNDGEVPEFDRFYYVTEENGNYIYNGIQEDIDYWKQMGHSMFASTQLGITQGRERYKQSGVDAEYFEDEETQNTTQRGEL